MVPKDWSITPMGLDVDLNKFARKKLFVFRTEHLYRGRL